MRHSNNPILAPLVASAVLALTACGGGGDDAVQAGPGPASEGTAEGTWQGTAPNGAELTLVIRQSGDYFILLSTSPAQDDIGGIATGKGTSSAGTFSPPPATDGLVGHYIARTSFTGRFESVNPFVPPSPAFTFTFDPATDITPGQAQAATVGTYVHSYLGLPPASMTIFADGSLTGMDTGVGSFGCPFTGFAVPTKGEKGYLYDIRFTYPSDCTLGFTQARRFDFAGYYDPSKKRLLLFTGLANVWTK